MDRAATEWHFDFGVYPITEEQATELMEYIADLVTNLGYFIGGGPRLYEEAEDGQATERD